MEATVQLKGLPLESTKSYIKNRVAVLLQGSIVLDVRLWLSSKYNEAKAKVIIQTHLELEEATWLLRQGKFIMRPPRSVEILSNERLGAEKTLFVPAGEKGPGDFPSSTVAQKNCQPILDDQAINSVNKRGVEVIDPQNSELATKLGDALDLIFSIRSADGNISLTNVQLTRNKSNAFSTTTTNLPIRTNLNPDVCVVFKPKNIGVYRFALHLIFTDTLKNSFQIVRLFRVKSGDPDIDEFLKPVAPYRPIGRSVGESKPEGIVEAPKDQRSAGRSPFSGVPQYFLPTGIKEGLRDGELVRFLRKPDDDLSTYVGFWQRLLWASELQAREDIKLFDLQKVKLQREGNLMVLKVPGLAEGRPSVLPGDVVNITWRGYTWKGRVERTRELDALLAFDNTFHNSLNTSIDLVDVRFTFSRTVFRTGHHGLQRVLENLGKPMLIPSISDVEKCLTARRGRTVPTLLKWANRDLNEEQQSAVTNILRGTCRPLPNLLFGPPGTGKTTTIAETIYQLARHATKPNILLIAPSNDAADIFVEKLASKFPPSEMCRILAYSRTLDQHSRIVQNYCHSKLSHYEITRQVISTQIVVCTVNFAARLSIYGVPRGHFNVLCVDEAGHATEPEVIAVATTLMDFSRKDEKIGQVILAGDPKQLGPVITSKLCRKFGLGTSYMERLTQTEAYARDDITKAYPAAIITKLVRNYRSHPAILKLPNELFYDGELIPSGDKMKTHNMTKWEYLPNKEFPVLFHAVHGENLRESNSPSWFNVEEAQLVMAYVERLVTKTRPPVLEQDIGVITPYARQAQKIRRALSSCGVRNIKVGSVETFQGQERRCIIISTVRAQSELINSDLKYNLGFVANEKRFNVAVTRPTSLLIVIGHPAVLATDKNNWLPLLRYCKENNSWVGEDWEEDERHGEDDTADDIGVSELIEDDENADPSAKMAQEAIGFVTREE